MADSEGTLKQINVQYILSSQAGDTLKGINEQLKLNKASLQDAHVGVQNFSKSTQKLKDYHEQLSKAVELNSKKTNLYKDAIEKTKAKMDENIAARDKLKSELDAEKAKLEDNIQIYGKNSEVTQNCKEKVADLEKQYKDSQKAIDSNVKTMANYATKQEITNTTLQKSQSELQKVNKQLLESQSKWVGAGKALQTAGDKIKTVGGNITNIGKNLAVGITVPIFAVGTALYKLGQNFDEAYDKIRAGTGKTGDSFNQLKDTFKKVYSETSASMDSASTAVTELEKRTGLTGDSLKDLSEQELKLSKLTKSDLTTTIESSTRMFQDAGIKQQDYGKALDYTYKVTQNTGISIDKLQQLMAQFGGPLRQMGFDWQDSAAMLGQFEKEGVNTELVVGSLRIALGKMAKEGIKDPSKALNEMIKKIKEAGTAGQANALALQMFGAKAGPDMAAAIREGRLDLVGLMNTLKNSPETINQAAKDTMSLNDKFEKLKNEMAVKLEPVAMKLMDSIEKSIPTIERLGGEVGKAIDWFTNLSPATQESIFKFAALAAVTGPVIAGIGGIVTTIGGTVKTIGGITKAIGEAKVAMSVASATAATTEGAVAGATTAAAGATAATGGLATGLGTAALAAAPWLLAAAGIAAGGYAIYKALNKEAIPSVDLFANRTTETAKQVTDAYGNVTTEYEESTIKISDSTKKAVSSYMKLDNDAKKSLTDLYTNSTTITNDTVTSMKQKYDAMGQNIEQKMDKSYNDTYTSMQNFYKNSNSLTDAEKQKSLQDLQKSYADKKTEINSMESQIMQIYQTASSGHRQLTQTEQQQIKDIQDKMRTVAVKNLSDTEQQSDVILERIKAYGTRITTEQASTEIKNAEKTRQQTVQKANEQYNQTVTTIEKMRDETHSITADQAQKMIDEARWQKEQTIAEADNQKQGVVKKISEMNSDTLNNVDSTTGKILSFWDKAKRWWDSWWPGAKNFTYTVDWKDMQGGGGSGNFTRMRVSANANGTNFFPGGLTTKDEHGYEIYQLPRGTKIYNHDASEDMVIKTAKAVAQNIVSSMPTMATASGPSGDIYLTMPIYLDGKVISTKQNRIMGKDLKSNMRGAGLK